MKEVRIEISSKLQNRIEGFIDQLCEEYKISDSLYGNILMAVVDFSELVLQISEETGLKELYISAGKDANKLHLKITNHEKIDFKHHINELHLKHKADMLFLINSLTDKLQFSDNGEQIGFTYYLDIDKQLNANDRRNLLKEYLNTSNKNIRV